MTFTADELLDLEVVATRQESVRFDLLDSTNSVIGTLAVDRDSAPSIANDASATTPRTLDGLKISAGDLNDVNTLTDRVRPVWVLGSGGPGYEFPLGVFLFGDAVRHVASYGDHVEGRLVDQTIILNDLLSVSPSYGAGVRAVDALRYTAAIYGIFDVAIDSIGAITGAPIVGLGGRDSGLKTMGLICANVGLLAPYFDNYGTLICRTPPDLDTVEPDFEYGAGGRVIADTIQFADGLATAPNRYTVRDSSASGSNLIGIYDLPDSAPNSYVNTGRHKVHNDDVQGLADQTTANAAARTAYAQDSSVFSTLTFSATPDPRHDTYDVVSFDGTTYIEHTWHLALAPGGPMQHDIRRVYV